MHLQRNGVERLTSVAQSKFLAAHIDGARYVELPGDDPLPYVGDVAAASRRSRSSSSERPHIAVDRVRATVLFTDIGHSTERVASVGDRRWREQLDVHARARAARGSSWSRGQHRGDSFFAVFDGPVRAIRYARRRARQTGGSPRDSHGPRPRCRLRDHLRGSRDTRARGRPRSLASAPRDLSFGAQRRPDFRSTTRSAHRWCTGSSSSTLSRHMLRAWRHFTT